MDNRRLVRTLRERFPTPTSLEPDPAVRSELWAGEQVVWLGGPSRWGLFRITPALVVLAAAWGFSVYLTRTAGLNLWQYLQHLFGTAEGLGTWLPLGLAAFLAGLFLLSLRDPRKRWTYVVTDRRLMTFHKGEKLREAGPDDLDDLRVHDSVEARLRGIGDVLWRRHRQGSEAKGASGPDHGRHGFRGMADPHEWLERLEEWREELHRAAREASEEFAAEGGRRGSGAAEGTTTLENRKYEFRLTVPAEWHGTAQTLESRPRRLLGFELPLSSTRTTASQPLHEAGEEWNLLEIAGRSGFGLKLMVHDGPPEKDFETLRAQMSSRLVSSDGDYQAGPFRGFRLDYTFTSNAYIRWVVLEGPGFHLELQALVKPDQKEAHLPAFEALLKSIERV